MKDTVVGIKTTETEKTQRRTRLAVAFDVDSYGESDVRIKCCVGKKKREKR